MSLEIFKSIKGYEGIYSISSWGRVRNDNTGGFRKLEETPKGYLRVSLMRGGIKKNHKVHRLVAQAFIPNTENLPQVNHKDGNPKNNSITNLEWIDNRGNLDHAMAIRKIITNEVLTDE